MERFQSTRYFTKASKNSCLLRMLRYAAQPSIQEERNYDGEERNEDDAGKGDSDGVSPPKASGSTDAEDVHSSNNAAKNKSD